MFNHKASAGFYTWPKDWLHCSTSFEPKPTNPPSMNPNYLFVSWMDGILGCETRDKPRNCYHWSRKEGTWKWTDLHAPMPEPFDRGDMVTNGQSVISTLRGRVAVLSSGNWSLEEEGQALADVRSQTLVWVSGLGVFCIGGKGPFPEGGRGIHSRVSLYSPSDKTWTQKASLPVPLQRPSCSEVTFRGNRSVFCAHGDDDSKTNATFVVAVYTLANDSWTRLPDRIGNYLTHSLTHVYKEKIYFLGGRDVVENKEKNSVEYFDLQTEEWTANPEEPAPALPEQSLSYSVVLTEEFYEI